MQPSDGSTAVTTSPEPSTFKRRPLTPEQQQFFHQRRAAIAEMQTRMNGALDFIVAENKLRGKVTLADDDSELIIEEG